MAARRVSGTGMAKPLTLGLLHRQDLNCQAMTMTAIQVTAIPISAATMMKIQAQLSKRRSSASKQSRWSDLDERRLLAYEKAGKSWEWIFCKFPGRTRAGDTYTLEHGSGPEAIRFPCRWTGSSSSSSCLLVPRCLPERIFESDLIPLSASPIAGAGTVEGSGVQSEANKGLDVWARHQK